MKSFIRPMAALETECGPRWRSWSCCRTNSRSITKISGGASAIRGPRLRGPKSAAHIAVALFTLTFAEADARRAGVARLSEHIAAVLDAPKGPDQAALDHEIAALLQRCSRFAHAVREQIPPEAAKAEFASDAGARILRITELATREQVAGLHEAVEQISSSLSPREQEELQVVVLGDHQARVRSLGMQYFKRRLREEPGVDRRVTYGEHISSEEEAISLVATRRLDERIALAFFGDEARLQRDVLGDAAKRCVEQMSFPEPA